MKLLHLLDSVGCWLVVLVGVIKCLFLFLFSDLPMEEDIRHENTRRRECPECHQRTLDKAVTPFGCLCCLGCWWLCCVGCFCLRSLLSNGARLISDVAVLIIVKTVMPTHFKRRQSKTE